MRRGNPVIVAPPGDYGEPRQALIVQAEVYAEHPSITARPLTSELLRHAAVPDHGGAERGDRPRLPSQLIVDKAITISRAKAGTQIGRLDLATLVDRRRA